MNYQPDGSYQPEAVQAFPHLRPGDPVIPTPPPPKPRAPRWVAPVVVAAAVITLGALVMSGDPAPAQAPAPLPAVTVTQTPAPAPTVTVSAPPADPVAYVPESCIDAIDAAERLDAQWGKVATVAGNTVEAAYNRDAAAIQKQTKKLDKISPKLKAARSDMATAAQECRDSQ